MRLRRRGNADEDQFFWKSSLAELRDFPTRWYEDIVKNAAGLILLGTTHLTHENHLLGYHENTPGLVTRPDTPKRYNTLSKELMDLNWRIEYVRALSGKFDKYVHQYIPDLPVLSVWEGQESKAMRLEESKRLLSRKWEEVHYTVVAGDLAKIGLLNEERMVADCDHYQSCTHNNAEFRQKIIGFCYEKLLEAHGRM
ncbi:hypothetical protein G6011_01170 [Alternaria panax]|uniref:Uncharacterized protein n=1 Tax=Alternaria panax TaxID=48097 RepID=A0AAD4IK90_9PLEO|nr:hypothetical protein G6011_01170 [Alternaria panax]